MHDSVLASLTLGYRPLWGRDRTLAGIQLLAEPDAGGAHGTVDAPHLLATLQELWSADSPRLLLSPQDRRLLAGLLQHAQADGPWIEVRGDWLDDAPLALRVQAAHRRGVRLLWRGDAAARPPDVIRAAFQRSIFSLQPELAAAALRAAHLKNPLPGARGLMTPVLAGQVYEGIESRLLMQHCLDQQEAFALLGWPDEDVLHAWHGAGIPVPPARRAVLALLHAIDADVSTDLLEQLLTEEPVLAVRFLQFGNSAALGLSRPVESIRHGLMMLGYRSLQQWLGQQLPLATDDPDLQPVKLAMMLRARLMEHILDAGIEDELRREVTLTGLLSTVDGLVHEPIGTALHRLPVSQRIYDAIVLGQGPYADSLDMATVLGGASLGDVRRVRSRAEFDVEDVNRALLRTLAGFHVGRITEPPAQLRAR